MFGLPIQNKTFTLFDSFELKERTHIRGKMRSQGKVFISEISIIIILVW